MKRGSRRRIWNRADTTDIRQTEGTTMERGVNVLALVKDSERFIFLYDDESAESLLETFGRYAADPDLSFSWYDAAMLSQKVRRLRRASQRQKEMNSVGDAQGLSYRGESFTDL